LNYDGNLLLLADAEPADGLGHLSRTAVLAREFIDAYHGRAFFCLSDRAHPAECLDHPRMELLSYPFDLDGAELWNHLVATVVSHLKIGAVVVDSYRLSVSFYEALARDERVASLIIDDDARLSNYPGDLLLNYSPLATELDYVTDPHTEKLLGLDYLLLAQPFRARGRAVVPARQNRVLVTLGGSDPEDVTRVICRGLRHRPELQVRVVLGPHYNDAAGLQREFADASHLEFIRDCYDLSGVAADSDWAITAAGVTCWELAYLGVPFIAIATAPGQGLNRQYLEERQLALTVCDLAELTAEKLQVIVSQLAAAPEQIVAVAARLAGIFADYHGPAAVIDGLITRAIHRELRRRTPLIYLRKEKIKADYSETAVLPEPHDKLRWGSAAGMENRFALLADIIATNRVKRVLDLGSGLGGLFAHLRRQLDGPLLVGVDLTLPLLRQAAVLPRCGYLNAELSSIPVRPASFDLVSLIGTIQNCGDPLVDIFRSAVEVLAPGGLLFLITKNLGWERFLSGALQPELDHNWFFSYEIEAALHDCQLTVVTSSGFLPRSGENVAAPGSHEFYYLARKAA